MDAKQSKLYFLTQNMNLPILKEICLCFQLHNKSIARDKQSKLLKMCVHVVLTQVMHLG